MKNEDSNKQNVSKLSQSEHSLLLQKNGAQGADYSTITISNNQSLEITDKTESFDLYKGLFFMFCSCLSKSCFSLLTKYILDKNTNVSSFQLMAYRSIFMLVINIFLAIFFWKSLFPEKLFSSYKTVVGIIVRSIFAITSMSLLVFAIKNMHVSDVYSLYYIYPAIILVLSLIFLKNEKFRPFDYVCLVVCFIGAILIVKPSWLFSTLIDSSQKLHHSKKPFLFFLVLLASCIKAIEDIIVRGVGKDAPALIIPFTYSLIGIVAFPAQMYGFDSIYYLSFSLGEWGIILVIATLTYMYQFFMALGLQNEGAGRVSMVNYIQVALMYVCDLTIFGKPLQSLDLIGTCLIFGFNFTNGLLKVSSRLEELNKKKLQKS